MAVTNTASNCGTFGRSSDRRAARAVPTGYALSVMSDDPARDLIEAARTGDPVATEELLSRHLNSLRAFVRLKMGRLVRAKEGSSDLVQSVCREALQDLNRFEYRDEAGFRHWLFRRAERKILKRGRFYRQEKRDAARERSLDDVATDDREILTGVEAFFTPSRQMAFGEQLDRLETAFQALPPDYREVIVLAKIVGLSHERIAERMKRTQTATWTLLSRALARLAIQLEKDRDRIHRADG